MAKTRVVVAMSGGVDSCVAAALLVDRGFDVIGITMQLWDHGASGEGRFDSCCSLSDVNDARMVAYKIGIPHYVVNYEREFRAGVVDYFAHEYAQGRTPNPCVMCNSKLKFDHLVERAEALGADWVATGHYARVVHHSDGRPSELYRGQDQRKDQSYFLFNLKPDMLRRTLFPLHDLTKDEVRAIAARYGLHTSTKKESQEICFVSGKRYTDFLEEHYPETTQKKGEIVDRAGRVLGRHEGIHLFTVGQRKGLNIASLVPKYVAAIDPETNRVVVDDVDGLAVESFGLGEINWLIPPSELEREADGSLTVEVVPRYRAKPLSAALLHEDDGRWRVRLDEHTRWVTPGQAAVLYRGDRVLGGGFISAVRTQRDVGRGVSQALG